MMGSHLDERTAIALSRISNTARIGSLWKNWMLGRRRSVALSVAGVVLGAGALLYAVQGVDTAGVADAFRNVGWWWVGAAAVANIANISAQGWAWRIGLQAGGAGTVARRHAIAATWVGKAGNQLLPGKVGEIARIALIRTHLPPEGREISRVVGSVVAQRAFYLVATVIVIAASTSMMTLPVTVPGGRWAPLAALTTLGLSAAALWRFAPRRRRRDRRAGRIRGMAASFAGGAGLLRPSRAGAAALGLHLVGVLAQLTMLECLLRGFDVATPPSAPLLIIALVGLVGAVPGAPGGAGLNQAALVAPLGAAYGVTASSALAFALGLQMLVAVVAAAGGLVGMIHHRRTLVGRTAIP